MAATAKEAHNKLVRLVVQDLKGNYSLTLPEANSEINDASRDVIAAMLREHGEAWLGHINLYHGNSEQCEEGYEPPSWTTPMWKYGGGVVYNFGAAFVAPKYDEELVRLILERGQSEYTGASDDFDRLDAIDSRLDLIGALRLHWS